ncbi:MAG: TIGR03560 family F420-dependent LLM class oxidoreductase [Microthrixaceae bacterium]
MHLSIWPSAQQSWQSIVEVTQHAERTGWRGVYFWDHFMGDGAGFGPANTPTLEASAVLAALGATTKRLRIGSLVFANTFRHPALLANWAATVDAVTNGRLVLGIGTGWQQNDHEQYGIELPSPAERIAMLDEACQVMTGLWRQQESSFSGKYFQLNRALCEPKPVQAHLPLLIGGKGDRMLGLVARYADEWNMWGLADVIAERSKVLDAHCEAIGRDPASIKRSAQALVMVTEDTNAASKFVQAVAPRAAIAGPVEVFAEQVQRWSEVGVTEVILPDAALGSGGQRLANLDALRAAVL